MDASTPPRRVRVYETLRTAHLERALELEPAHLLYLESRYDFDGALARQVRPEQARHLRTAWLVLRRGYDEIEINEPMAIPSVRRSWYVVSAVRLRDLVTRRRSRVVVYAIGNIDPATRPRPRRLLPHLGRRLDERLARRVWRQVDRVVYGTETARDLYGRVFGPMRAGAEARTIPAVPAPCSCGTVADAKEPGRVLFLGALTERKGIDTVLGAWPQLAARSATARLVIVGRGPFHDDVERLAAEDPRVTFVHDPPRDRIHEELRSASVVVLPSRRMPAWREQVGLPIVEGLAHGCTVVTTDETGIASWLSRHGHTVVEGDAGPGALADALAAAVAAPLDPADVLRSLPAEDARLRADRWLFAPSEGR
jgi:glycosyltransferase involved in cell wall biosynthesis